MLFVFVYLKYGDEASGDIPNENMVKTRLEARDRLEFKRCMDEKDGGIYKLKDDEEVLKHLHSMIDNDAVKINDKWHASERIEAGEVRDEDAAQTMQDAFRECIARCMAFTTLTLRLKRKVMLVSTRGTSSTMRLLSPVLVLPRRTSLIGSF